MTAKIKKWLHTCVQRVGVSGSLTSCDLHVVPEGPAAAGEGGAAHGALQAGRRVLPPGGQGVRGGQKYPTDTKISQPVP